MQRTVLLSQFCLPVCLSDSCIVTKRNNRLSISQHHTIQNGDISSHSTPVEVVVNYSLPPEIFAESDPPPSKNTDFDRFPLIASQP